jgi:hypothetical protein
LGFFIVFGVAMFMGVGSAVIMSKCEEDKEGRIEK